MQFPQMAGSDPIMSAFFGTGRVEAYPLRSVRAVRFRPEAK
jgi:hypothetical protein